MNKTPFTFGLALLCGIFLLFSCQSETGTNTATDPASPTENTTTPSQTNEPTASSSPSESSAPTTAPGGIPQQIVDLLTEDAKGRAIEKLQLPKTTSFIDEQASVEKATKNENGYLVGLVRKMPDTGEEKKVYVIYLYTGGDMLRIDNYRMVNVLQE